MITLKERNPSGKLPGYGLYTAEDGSYNHFTIHESEGFHFVVHYDMKGNRIESHVGQYFRNQELFGAPEYYSFLYWLQH